MKKTTIFFITILLLVIFPLSGCQKKISESNILKNIEFELISKNTEPNTNILYEIKMTNNSDYTIVQNDVLFSYPSNPDTTDGETTNPFQILTTGNKLNIKPKKSVILTVEFSDAYYKKFTDSETKYGNIFFTGYFDKLSEKNHFDFATSLKLK